MQDYQLQSGLFPYQIPKAAELFWQAFQRKLGWALGPEDKALEFLEYVIDPEHALAVVDENGNVLGIAGFKTREGAFVGGTLADIQRVYGFMSGLARGLLLAVLERKPDDGILLMDGIFVDENARGKGVGTELLNAIKAKSVELGCNRIRLDVIDTNPRARKLYEREGFAPRDVSHLGPLSFIFGFNSSTTMIYELPSM